MVVESAALTDIGRKRQGNEDSHFADDETLLYLVADGMGGHQAGEVASGMVVEHIAAAVKRWRKGGPAAEQIPDHLIAAIGEANAAVYGQARQNASQRGMGSTVSVVMLHEGAVVAANVGDSPIFLVRENQVRLLSVPHTMVAEYEALSQGSSVNLAEKYRHIITRAVGVDKTVKPDITQARAEPNDVLVVCSDGLTDKVAPEEIAAIVIEVPPEPACRRLVDLANERGGDDNITVIVIKICEVSGKSRLSEKGRSPDPGTSPNNGLRVPVSIDTQDASFSAFIREIGAGWMFIETDQAFSAGTRIDMTASEPDGTDAFMITGTVVERRPGGIRVTFPESVQHRLDRLAQSRSRKT